MRRNQGLDELSPANEHVPRTITATNFGVTPWKEKFDLGASSMGAQPSAGSAPTANTRSPFCGRFGPKRAASDWNSSIICGTKWKMCEMTLNHCQPAIVLPDLSPGYKREHRRSSFWCHRWQWTPRNWWDAFLWKPFLPSRDLPVWLLQMACHPYRNSKNNLHRDNELNSCDLASENKIETLQISHFTSCCCSLGDGLLFRIISLNWKDFHVRI